MTEAAPFQEYVDFGLLESIYTTDEESELWVEEVMAAPVTVAVIDAQEAIQHFGHKKYDDGSVSVQMAHVVSREYRDRKGRKQILLETTSHFACFDSMESEQMVVIYPGQGFSKQMGDREFGIRCRMPDADPPEWYTQGANVNGPTNVQSGVIRQTR